MSDVEKLTPQNLLLVLQFVAPGFLAVYFRSLFVRRVEASFKDNLLLFIVISVVYSFITFPIWLASMSLGSGRVSQWLVWFVSLVALPMALGCILGVATQKGWIRQILAEIGLHPLSPYRTGWDWAFSQTSSPTYLLVTLDDGSSVAGLFSRQSLAASEHAYRDIFIEVAYEIDDQGNWVERAPRQSILIAGKSIRYVEFFAGG